MQSILAFRAPAAERLLDRHDDGTSDVLLQIGGTVVDWIIKNSQYQGIHPR